MTMRVPLANVKGEKMEELKEGEYVILNIENERENERILGKIYRIFNGSVELHELLPTKETKLRLIRKNDIKSIEFINGIQHIPGWR